MCSDVKVSQAPTNRKKLKRWIPQIVNGIISISLGITTLQLKRPHTYVYGGEHRYDPTYPYQGPIVNTLISQQPLTFLAKYSPVLAALMVNILSGIYLFKARVNKEIKLWVKIVIIFLNTVLLAVAAFIPSLILPAIEHPLFVNIMTGPTFYDVYKYKHKKSLAKHIKFFVQSFPIPIFYN